MLTKLMKYDFKALNRYLILIHAFLLAAAAAVRIFLTEPLRPGDSQSIIVSTFGMILFVLIAVGISFATGLLTAIRFYKNLFSDEGYFNPYTARYKGTALAFQDNCRLHMVLSRSDPFYLEASF